MALEVERKMNEIADYARVQCIVCISFDGLVVKSYGISDEETNNKCAYFAIQLMRMFEENVLSIISNGDGELEYLRIKSKEGMKYIITMSEDYIMVVIKHQKET